MINPHSDHANTGDAAAPDPKRPAQNDLDPSIIEWLRQSSEEFRDESLAPEVDRDVLTRLVRKELDEPSSRLVLRLVHSFQSWRNAHNEILAAEARRAS